MSYENPNQVIDTQSGQNIARMQQSIGGSFDKFAASKKTEWDRRAEANRKITDAANKRATKAQNSAIAEASKNKSINFDGINDVINKGNDILLKNPKNRTAEDRAYISNMDNMGTNIASTLANVAANGESYMKARNIKQGEEGGHSRDAGFTLPPGGKDDFIGLQAADILFDYKGAPGSKVSRFDAATNDFYIDIYNEEGKLLQTVMDSDMSSLTNYQKVPVERKNQDKIGKEVIDTMDIGNPVGIAYRDKNGKLNDLVKDTAVPGETSYYRPLSKDVFRQKAIAQTNAQVSALPANDAIAMYNNTLNPTGKKIKQRADFNDPGKIEEGWEKENRNAVLVSTETNLEISTKDLTIEQQQEKGKLVNKDLYEIQKKYLDAVVRQTEAVHTSKSLGKVDEFNRQMKRNSEARARAKLNTGGSTASTSVAKNLYDEMNNDITATVGKMAGFVGGSKPIYKDNKVTAEFYVGNTQRKETITFDLTNATDAQRFYERLELENQYNIFGKSKEGVQNKLDFKKIVANGTRYRESEQANDVFAAKNPGLNEKELDVKRDADVKVHLAVEGKVASLKKKYPKQSSMNTSQYVRYINTKALKEINSKT